MIVNLDPLPCLVAVDLIKMCVRDSIDLENSTKLVAAMSMFPMPDDIKWELDIPEEYLTLALLSHPLYNTEQE